MSQNMLDRRYFAYAIVALLGATTGCGSSKEPAPGTGARETVQRFYDALIAHDWPKAYASLSIESQKQCPLSVFQTLGTVYVRKLDFAPTKVFIRSCEEHEKQAIAHVVLEGEATSAKKHYKDSIALQFQNNEWRALLNSTFGKQK